ncbi:MAG: RDD family protein [Lachnospiraceae bacterium]|nr:RDD family protein [Lachnospiraceae bacterium]
MSVSIEKGSVWKRFSAFLFDIIVMAVLALLAATLLSLAFGYDGTLDSYNEIRTGIEESYGITFQITEEEYLTYDDAKKAQYDAAYEALNANSEAVRLYALLTNYSLMIVTFAILFAFLILEFIVPLLLKEGRTLGKKIFGLCVVRQNSVRISGPVLFIRSILGKCVIELLVPVFIIILILFGRGDIFLTILLFLIPLVNVIIFLATKNHYQLHDLLAVTVVADYATQKVFADEDERTAFIAAEEAERVRASREENVFSSNVFK